MEILEKYDDFISIEILYKEIPELDEKKLNANIIFLEKDDKIRVKVGIDSKNFKIKIKK